jgi:hypothetical protein
MRGDIILQDCGKDFVLPVFCGVLHMRIPPLYPDPVLDLFGFSLSWCFVQQ